MTNADDYTKMMKDMMGACPWMTRPCRTRSSRRPP